MTITINPSEAREGDVICNWPATNPLIREVETWPSDSFVKITFVDGGVLNTYDRFPITVEREEASS